MIGSSADWKLTTTAYAHQRAAIEKLSQLKVGALFMDMGTGKTRTALELIWLRRKRIVKCVWCCPVSLMEETRREILRHTSCIDTDIHMVGPRTREENIPQAMWYLVGLESLGRSPRVAYVLDRLIDGGTFLVVDESTYIKGHRETDTASYRVRYPGTVSADSYRNADPAGNRRPVYADGIPFSIDSRVSLKACLPECSCCFSRPKAGFSS